MKRFSKELYVRDMYKTYTIIGKELDKVPEWVNDCDGKIIQSVDRFGDGLIGLNIIHSEWMVNDDNL